MGLWAAAEFKVGLLVIGVAGIIAYMSMQVSEDTTLFGRTSAAWFLVKDAGGLVKGSSIKSAGIPVGTIKEITLQDGLARVELKLKPEFKLRTSAVIETKSQGILGDKYVSVSPGSVEDPELEDGGQILNVKDTGSLDNVIAEVGKIAGSLQKTAQALQEAVSEDGTREHILGRIVSNIEKITQDLSEVTAQNKEQIHEIITQVNSVTKTLDEMLNEEGEGGLRQQIKSTMARLDSAMKNIDEISAKINNGEGTVGRLINDEETVEGLNTAIDGINGFLDTAGKTQTALDFNSTYLAAPGLAKTSVGVFAQPGLDRFYYIGIVDDPAGVVEETDRSVTTGGTTTDTSEVVTYKSKTKFTLLYGKNFYDFTVKGGLIENAGGIGFDYRLLSNKLKFSLEAFEFSTLNLRAQVKYNIWHGVYLLGGYEDILDKQSKRSGYLGAGLFLTNDDLKLLMTKLPAM
jgi:phospholipid/cholesterol/gamma-HCH transport system substrate-binding protein